MMLEIEAVHISLNEFIMDGHANQLTIDELNEVLSLDVGQSVSVDFITIKRIK